MFEIKSYEEGYKWNVVSICFGVASIIISIAGIIFWTNQTKKARKELEEMDDE